MQETRYFDKNGDMKSLREAFTGRAQEALKQDMDSRLNELQRQGHFLSERRSITQREAKDLRKKFKKFTRKERKAAMAKYKVIADE